MKAYIKIDVKKELPEKYEQYCLTNQGWIYFGQGAFISDIKWWLKEISLSDLMIEFAELIELIPKDYNDKHIEFLYTRGKTYSLNELLQEFLTEKSIITI
jgi:hypothetical protein